MTDRLALTAMTVARAGLAAKAAAVAAALLGILALSLIAIAAWWAAIGGAQTQSACAPATPTTRTSGDTVPAELVPLFTSAASRYRLGEDGPAILAGLTKVESDFGRNMGPSSAGAVGWTQFMPATWEHYGIDADGDGTRDPFNAVDAIHSAANYLRASGAPRDWHRALFAYNHADWYVRRVLRVAETFRGAFGDPVALDPLGCTSYAIDRVDGKAEIVPVPGSPGESIDARILPDVLALQREYRFKITDGYAPTGHEEAGEHPLGLAVDLVPGPGGTWDDLDRLAAWAEPTQGQPRPPFRWVGYDGDEDHGRGHHLHLSWDHAPVPARRPPAAWVLTLLGRRAR
jgi:hypothetical protein